MRDADSGSCMKCPRGTYSDTLGTASCTPCAEGLTTGREGADAVNSCTGKNRICKLMV